MRLIFGGNSDIGKAINGHHLLRNECDVSDWEQVHNVVNKYKPTEIVQCAGVIYPSGIPESSIQNWEQEIKINLLSSYYIAKFSAIYKAKMVFIGSTSGLRGRGNWSGYCASKAGLISLTQSLAEEGFQAWVLNISRTDTKMRTSLFPGEDKSALMSTSQVAKVVEDCFNNVYKSGSALTVRKDSIEVIE